MSKSSLLLLIIMTVVYSCSQPAPTEQVTAFINATIYPSPTDPVINNGTVLVKNGKITAVGDAEKVKTPAGATIVDCKGLAITAGFWNSHIHMMGPDLEKAANLPADTLTKRFQRMLSMYGVTYAFDIGSFPENTMPIKKRIDSGEVLAPTIFTAGMPFVPPGGTPFYVAPLKLPEFTSVQETGLLVNQNLTLGVDATKIFAASPVQLGKVVVMPLDFAKQAVLITHEHQKPVFAHPTTTGGIQVAMASGVDILAHTTPDDGLGWPPEFVSQMVEANLYLIPTIKLWKWELERNNLPDTVVKNFIQESIEQLRAFKAAGGKVLFGTDIGYMSDFNPLDEYHYMQSAGLSFQDILASLTTTPAQKFKHDNHTGKIAAGMDADLVILNGDPSANIDALINVHSTYKKGIKIY